LRTGYRMVYLTLSIPCKWPESRSVIDQIYAFAHPLMSFAGLGSDG
jgi:hypothetical protein